MLWILVRAWSFPRTGSHPSSAGQAFSGSCRLSVQPDLQRAHHDLEVDEEKQRIDDRKGKRLAGLGCTDFRNGPGQKELGRVKHRPYQPELPLRPFVVVVH